MVAARVILISAMLTAGIVEMTKTTALHLASEAPKSAPMPAPMPASKSAPMPASKSAPVEAPPEMSATVPASTAPAARACTETAWPYRPGACLRPENAPQGPEPRRPVRMIEEQRPAPPIRMPGRVSFG
ncbi:hypothetical protein LRS73_19965 [Methylobacterium currus]|uniref:hypothetical protein n=1 Tax=Methylobacterium currus TaxID=2051553 RepID=UPI001E51244F|nr:hypothetical protein [Methylobacterium currus]UHC14799.1 hypothetical protein LRS73_19965 [Methylobacterium currus]